MEPRHRGVTGISTLSRADLHGDPFEGFQARVDGGVVTIRAPNNVAAAPADVRRLLPAHGVHAARAAPLRRSLKAFSRDKSSVTSRSLSTSTSWRVRTRVRAWRANGARRSWT